MTSKLPVVGKRYRYRNFPKMEATVNAIKEGPLFTATQTGPFVHFELGQGPIRLDCFWDSFLDLDEELPDSNPQEAEKQVSEVERALEELKNEVKKIYVLQKSPQSKDADMLDLNLSLITFAAEKLVLILEAEKRKGTTNQENKYFQAGWVGAREMFRKANSETKEAMDLLQFQVNNYCKEYINEVDPAFLPPLFIKTLERAKNLLEALEAEKKINFPKEPNWVGVDLAKEQSWSNVSKPEPEIDMKEDRVEPVSIWKDVSELPKEKLTQGFVKDLSNRVDFGLMRKGLLEMEGDESVWPASNHKFLSITDFINSFEQMQKTNADLHSRLEKIEFHLKHHR